MNQLDLVENIAISRKKSIKIELVINGLVIGVEHIIYLLSFLLFFQWRVLPLESVFSLHTIEKYSYMYDDYLFLFLIIHIVYTIIMLDRGLFKLFRQTSLIDDYFLICKTVFVAFMIAIGILFLLQTSIVYSRILILGYAVSIVIISSVFRTFKNLFIFKVIRKTNIVKRVLVIGAGKIGNSVKDFIQSHRNSGYHFVGFLDDMKQGSNILGSINEMESIINRYNINEIIITIPSERARINNTIGNIRKYDITIKIIPELYDILFTTVRFHQNEIFPYFELLGTPLNRGFNYLIKRTIDVSLSLLGLLITLPIFIISAVVIKLDSKGPVFFKQKRVGKHGAPFNMYKFRSMVVNAEELKSKLQNRNEADGPAFKIRNDPRVTKFGKFIRKYSIDELPQLINVLKGEMSLIGPRPPLPSEVEKYDDYQWRRLSITPGITGLWQVSGRSDLNFNDWVGLDIFYIENWSVSMDIKIFLRTIPVVLVGKGAY